MDDKKLKILAIAPYQNLKTSILALSESYPMIDLHVYVGDLENGAELARQYMNDSFDMILSRGGTAELIKEFSLIPVVEIPLMVFDILRTLSLSSNSVDPCAVIGFPSITVPAMSICDTLKYDMKIKTIHRAEDALPALQEIIAQGYQFILCDTITETLARQSGIHPILITSGPDSICFALDEALNIYNYSNSLLQKYSVLEDTLKNHSSKTIILYDDGNVFFSNYDSENISTVMAYLKDMMTHSPDLVFSKEFHLITDCLYTLSLYRTAYNQRELFIFYIEPNPIPAGNSKHGLRFTNYTDMVDMYTKSFYALTSESKTQENQIQQLSQVNIPVMILGELGTGKNQVAAKLFIGSPLKHNPYIIIDCPLINDKHWSFLTKHYNSPLFDKDNTIFISNIQALSELQQQELLSMILDTNIHKRNRLIFSCAQTLKNQTEDPSKAFIRYLPCATILLPNLRNKSSDIASASKRYLNTLNIELSKQIIGFEKNALELLSGFSWPENFLQLKRVLSNLALITDGQLIRAEDVQMELDKESFKYITPLSDIFNYDRPLSDMIQEITKVVLSRCDGNQTRAAKQLGIGRTTLWRYLNSDEE